MKQLIQRRSGCPGKSPHTGTNDSSDRRTIPQRLRASRIYSWAQPPLAIGQGEHSSRSACRDMPRCHRAGVRWQPSGAAGPAAAAASAGKEGKRKAKASAASATRRRKNTGVKHARRAFTANAASRSSIQYHHAQPSSRTKKNRQKTYQWARTWMDGTLDDDGLRKPEGQDSVDKGFGYPEERLEGPKATPNTEGKGKKGSKRLRFPARSATTSRNGSYEGLGMLGRLSLASKGKRTW